MPATVHVLHRSTEPAPRRGRWRSLVVAVAASATLAALLAHATHHGAAHAATALDARPLDVDRTPAAARMAAAVRDEEYGAIRPAGDTPPIPSSETWPAP